MAFQVARSPGLMDRPGMGRSGPFIPPTDPGGADAQRRPMPPGGFQLPQGREAISGMLAGGGLDGLISRLQGQLGGGRAMDPGVTDIAGGRAVDADPAAGSTAPPMAAPIMSKPFTADPDQGRLPGPSLPFKKPEVTQLPAPDPAPPPGSDDAFEAIAAKPARETANQKASRLSREREAAAPARVRPVAAAPASQPNTLAQKPQQVAPPAQKPVNAVANKPAPAPGSDDAFEAIAAKPTPTRAPTRQAPMAPAPTLTQMPARVPPPDRMQSITGPGLQAPGNAIANKPAVGGMLGSEAMRGQLNGTPAGQNFLKRLETLGISDIQQGIELATKNPESILGRMFANSGLRVPR